jgi:hypothetical protein
MQSDRDLGIGAPTHSSDTENGPATYTEIMAPLSLLQTKNLTKTSDNLVVLGGYVVYVANQSRTLSVLDYTDFMHQTWC